MARDRNCELEARKRRSVMRSRYAAEAGGSQLLLVVIFILVSLAGCRATGGKSASPGAIQNDNNGLIRGEYGLFPDSSLERHLRARDYVLADFKRRAATGDKQAISGLKSLEQNPMADRTTFLSYRFKFTPPSGFVFAWLDGRTGKLVRQTGQYQYDPQTGLVKVTMEATGSKGAPRHNVIPTTMVFDPKEGSLTFDGGGSWKITMKRR